MIGATLTHRPKVRGLDFQFKALRGFAKFLALQRGINDSSKARRTGYP